MVSILECLPIDRTFGGEYLRIGDRGIALIAYIDERGQRFNRPPPLRRAKKMLLPKSSVTA